MRCSVCFTVAAPVLAAAIAGCSGGAASMPAQPSPATHRDVTPMGGARSWMAKDAAAQNLLYVADPGSGRVEVYSYPWGGLKGALANIQDPAAICADGAGHVFVVEPAMSQIVEYGRAGIKPIATLPDPNYWAGDCAVNPMTGDLAVANVFLQNGGQGTPGNLVIYRNAKGKPQSFTTPSVENFMYVAYDDSGNLYADGMGPSNFEFALAEMPSGKTSLMPVKLDQSIENGSTGAVAWDGRYLAVGDTSSNTIYEFSISKHRGTKTGATSIAGVASGYFGYFCFRPARKPNVQAKQVIIPESSDVGYWRYPAGGNVRRYVTKSLVDATRAAVSEVP